MTHELSLKETQKKWHGTLKSYLIGFVVSLVLTALSFYLVAEKMLSGDVLIYALIGLAVLQAFVQLFFFLHVGQEEAKPRWATIVFSYTFLILLIVLIGSLWIMHDLNDRMMPEMKMEMGSA